MEHEEAEAGAGHERHGRPPFKQHKDQHQHEAEKYAAGMERGTNQFLALGEFQLFAA